mgnify:CR=1 FL=1
MNNSLKYAILFAILVLPGLIFLFLKTFGENHYDLPVENPVVAGCEPNLEDGTNHHIPAFSLVDQDSAAFTRERLRGTVHIANFFFTSCPDICLQVTAELRRVQELVDSDSYQLVSYSIDPAHDTPSVLRDYAGKYKASSTNWSFVTGDFGQLQQLARCGYYILAKRNEMDKQTFVHSDNIVLIDKEGKIRGYYSGTDRKETDRLIIELQVLLEQDNS